MRVSTAATRVEAALDISVKLATVATATAPPAGVAVPRGAELKIVVARR
jgi:hypothetical protein